MCAGIFTANLKRIDANDAREEAKYALAKDMLENLLFKKIRSAFICPPYFDVYKFGVREVSNNAGLDIAKKISTEIATLLHNDLMAQLNFDNE